MFIVVYLVEPKVHTIVPQQFVYELWQANLFNRGLNQNQNRLIYFSQELFNSFENGLDVDQTEYIPNFELAKTNVYPLPDNLQETCFIGRLVKFWGE